MSHLAHLITVKQDLIAKGITNPGVQNDIVRGAYVRALASFDQRALIAKAELSEFYSSILGYWNETSPVQGPLVIAELRKFNADLYAQLINLGTVETVSASFIRPEGVPEDMEISKLNGFQGMVEALLNDCNKKLAQWREHGQFQAKGV